MTSPFSFAQSEEPLRTIDTVKEMLSPSFMLAVANSEGTIIELNENFQQAFGYTPSQVQLSDFHIPDSDSTAEASWQQLIVNASLAGQWSGRICFYTESGELAWLQATVIPFAQSDSPNPVIVIIFNDTQARRERDHWRQLACLHELTQLPNRRAFAIQIQSYIQKANRIGKKLAILSMDINKFKRINDRFGHLVGDEVLIEIGRRLKSLPIGNGGAFHFSGDEFVVVQYYQECVIEQVKSINSLCSEPVMSSKGLIDVGMSIGVSIYPDHSSDIEKLLDYADMAMFEAKNRSASLYEVYKD